LSWTLDEGLMLVAHAWRPLEESERRIIAGAIFVSVVVAFAFVVVFVFVVFVIFVVFVVV